ncbi:MAG: hypothetical protein P4M15_00310, partial [Alphaproteobacteria bacterium]|nr:hypothetical protein [Alphaproteobacteria bacterium]
MGAKQNFHLWKTAPFRRFSMDCAISLTVLSHPENCQVRPSLQLTTTHVVKWRANVVVGSIIERRRKDGSTAYMAQIMLMREGKIAHRENQTFDRKPAAAAWIKKREAELARPGAVLGQSQKVRCA